MFSVHQRNILTRGMFAQMLQCDEFGVGVDEAAAFSWPGIYPQDDGTLEGRCFAARVVRTMQGVITLTNYLLTVGFLDNNVIEQYLLCFNSYVWSANSMTSERRANQRDCVFNGLFVTEICYFAQTNAFCTLIW